jgi:hypothetical protein
LERKDRSYYLINGKKGIELPTIPMFFHRKSANVEFICLLGHKKGGFFKKACPKY